MAGALQIAGMAIATLGIFFGFYFLGSHPRTSIEIVTTTCVGIVGFLAFVRHVVFHRADAERLGWQTERPDWQFEVGFANLAFAIMGGLAAFGSPDFKVHGVILLGYAVYLFQAAMLHLYRHVTDEKSSTARLWRSVVPTLLYAGMMTYFAVFALRF